LLITAIRRIAAARQSVYTLEEAFKTASIGACPGDTVLVSPGTYHECVEIPQTKHNLVLRADGHVVINGNFSGTKCRAVITAGNIERINQFNAASQPQELFGFPKQGGRGPVPYSPNWLAIAGGGGFNHRFWCPGDPNWPAADLPGNPFSNPTVQPFNGTAFTPWERGPHNLTIHGFEIVGARAMGIYISAGDSYNIESNDIHDTGAYGTFPVCSSYGVTRNNRIHEVSDAGIYNGDDLGGWVVGNKVYNCRFGVEKEATDNGLIEYNSFHNNAMGILVQYLPWLPRKGAKGHVIRHNLIYNNNNLTYVDDGLFGFGIWLLAAQDSTILGNTIYNHDNFGVLVTDQNREWYTPYCDVSSLEVIYGAATPVFCGGSTDLANCRCPLNDFAFPVPPTIVPQPFDVPELGQFGLPGFNILQPATCLPGAIDEAFGPRAPDCGYNYDLYARNILVRNNHMYNNGDNSRSPFQLADVPIHYTGTASNPLPGNEDLRGYDVFISSNLRRDVSESTPHGYTTVCVESNNVLQSTHKLADSYWLSSLRQIADFISPVSFPMVFDSESWPVRNLVPGNCSPSGQLPQMVPNAGHAAKPTPKPQPTIPSW
jgi:hypothetical protein